MVMLLSPRHSACLSLSLLVINQGDNLSPLQLEFKISSLVTMQFHCALLEEGTLGLEFSEADYVDTS